MNLRSSFFLIPLGSLACFSESDVAPHGGTSGAEADAGTTTTSTSDDVDDGTSMLDTALTLDTTADASSTGVTTETGSSSGGSVIDYALAFEGANDGVTPSLPGLPPNHTIEFWLRSGAEMHGAFLYTAIADPTPRGWYFIHDDPEGGGLAFTNVLVFINYDERPAWQYVVGMDLRAQVGWHHIAVTKAIDGLVRMWVDGGMVAEYQFGSPFAVSERPLTIGPSLADAQIDDVRISDVVRYDALFEPPDDMIVDANTLYLWRFDEGAGNEAVDDVAGVAFEFASPLWVEQ